MTDPVNCAPDQTASTVPRVSHSVLTLAQKRFTRLREYWLRLLMLRLLQSLVPRKQKCMAHTTVMRPNLKKTWNEPNITWSPSREAMASALTLPASLLSLVQFQVTEVCDGSAPLRLRNFQYCGLDWVSDAKKQKDRSQSSTWESCKWFNYLLSVWSFTHYQRTPPAPENKKFYFSFWSFCC